MGGSDDSGSWRGEGKFVLLGWSGGMCRSCLLEIASLFTRSYFLLYFWAIFYEDLKVSQQFLQQLTRKAHYPQVAKNNWENLEENW